MKNKAEIIKALKELTVAERTKDSFEKALSYFLEHIGENVPLRGDGEVLEGDNEFYKGLLKPVTQYFGKDVGITFMLLVRMNGTEFIHGLAFLSNGISVTLYFFEDINVGMAIACSLNSSCCDYFRLSLKFGKKSHDLIVPENLSTHN